MRKLNKLNIFYNSVDNLDTNADTQTSKEKTVENIPSQGSPANSPIKEMKKIADRINSYKLKIKDIPDGDEKTKLLNDLGVVEKFVEKDGKIGEKKLTELLESRNPKTEEYKQFVSALQRLSSKFDKKENKELTEEEKIKKIEKEYGVNIEKTDEGMYVLKLEKTSYTFSDLVKLEQKLTELGIEKRTNLEISKEDTEKLKTMSNDEFLKYPPEERLKYITKEHANAKTLKENDELTFTFTFDGVYNKDLWEKTTAGQTLPKSVSTVQVGDTIYSRKGVKGEFFTKHNKRLIINEGTHIKIGKPRTSEEIEKIENHNSLVYKAYMGELKKEDVSDKQQNEFFDKDGKLLKKYELTDKEKKRFKNNTDIVKEAIDRNIDPKFATLVFSEAVKGKSIMDTNRMTNIEDMFTEFDRQRPNIAMWNGEELKDGKYPDEFAVKMLTKFGGEKWKTLAKEYGLDETRINNSIKQVLANDGVNLDNINNPKIKEMLSYANSLVGTTSGILGAKHCTDWVSKIYQRKLGIKDADSARNVYNPWDGNNARLLPQAPVSVQQTIQPGDYVAITTKHGTHGVIALGPVKNGKLPTLSYPNDGKPIKRHSYSLAVHKIIRVKRPAV